MKNQSPRTHSTERRKRTAIIAVKWFLILFATFWLFLEFRHIADMERGYRAHGSEYAAFLIPIFWAIKEKNWRETRKYREEKERAKIASTAVTDADLEIRQAYANETTPASGSNFTGFEPTNKHTKYRLYTCIVCDKRIVFEGIRTDGLPCPYCGKHAEFQTYMNPKRSER